MAVGFCSGILTKILIISKTMTPEHLYRYRTFHDREERTIVHDEVYFPSPLEFNDPFDCLVTYSTDCSEEEFRELV